MPSTHNARSKSVSTSGCPGDTWSHDYALLFCFHTFCYFSRTILWSMSQENTSQSAQQQSMSQENTSQSSQLYRAYRRRTHHSLPSFIEHIAGEHITVCPATEHVVGEHITVCPATEHVVGELIAVCPALECATRTHPCPHYSLSDHTSLLTSRAN